MTHTSSQTTGKGSTTRSWKATGLVTSPNVCLARGWWCIPSDTSSGRLLGKPVNHSLWVKNISWRINFSWSDQYITEINQPIPDTAPKSFGPFTICNLMTVKCQMALKSCPFTVKPVKADQSILWLFIKFHHITHTVLFQNMCPLIYSVQYAVPHKLM